MKLRDPGPRILGRYRVTGKRAYRDHEPGSIVVLDLDALTEQRAIRRRALELLERVSVSVADVPFTLPSGANGKIPLTRNERDAGERRLSTLERR